MDPEISGAELLDIAQRTLTVEVIQHLEGDPRNIALMIGRAMRMVARECAQQQRFLAARSMLLALVDETDESDRIWTLCRNIRDGQYDADPQLHTALWADAAIRTSISKPSRLARTERRLVGLSEDTQSNDAG
jgi:hypothetical protein